MKKHTKRNRIAACVLLLVLGFFFGPKLTHIYKKDRLKHVNVILLTLDTLRVDFVGAYGKHMAHTPALDRMADEGVRFETCISQTPLTLPSHTTMLSGTYPLHHQVRDNGGFCVPQNLELVSEILKKQGFATSAFIGSYVLHSSWGINQGFDVYSDQFDLSKYERVSLGNVRKPASEVLGNAREWLKSNKKKKFFSWIHLYDPHAPYEPPSPYKEKYPNRPYRGAVEYMDDQLGQFFEFLKAEGISDNTLMIIAADHGESLGQHGEQTHGFFIYEPTVHVPLIIHAPFRFPASTVHETVELADITPTILDCLGIPIPSFMQGESLLGVMFKDKTLTKQEAYTETYFPRLHFGWSELKAIYQKGSFKYIQAPNDELYDIKKDADEKNNLALKKSYQTGKARHQIEKFIREKSQHAQMPGQEKRLDREEIEKLAALGYLTTVVKTKETDRLPDPKGKVRIFNDLSTAKEMMANGKHNDAIALLKKILQSEPNLIDGMLQLGNVYYKNRMFEDALHWHYEVLKKKPDYNAAMINVLNSLEQLGRYDQGLEEARRFLTIFPNDYTFYNEMANFHLLKNEFEKAVDVLNQSIALESSNPQAYTKLGAISIIQKDYRQARLYLEKAAAVNPYLKNLNFHRAEVEEALGNTEKAIFYYQKEADRYPKDYKTAYNLAEDLRKRGMEKEAVIYYQKCLDANPRFNIPYFMIARYYLGHREHIDQAIELCLRGIEIKPLNKYTVLGYYLLSDIYSVKGNQTASDSYYRKGEMVKKDLEQKNRWNE
ncbi:MAG: sulfatase-like hydrolase/transferase [Candidatus Omnitrophota bacterium]